MGEELTIEDQIALKEAQLQRNGFFQFEIIRDIQNLTDMIKSNKYGLRKDQIINLETYLLTCVKIPSQKIRNLACKIICKICYNNPEYQKKFSQHGGINLYQEMFLFSVIQRPTSNLVLQIKQAFKNEVESGKFYDTCQYWVYPNYQQNYKNIDEFEGDPFQQLIGFPLIQTQNENDCFIDNESLDNLFQNIQGLLLCKKRNKSQQSNHSRTKSLGSTLKSQFDVKSDKKAKKDDNKEKTHEIDPLIPDIVLQSQNIQSVFETNNSKLESIQEKQQTPKVSQHDQEESQDNISLQENDKGELQILQKMPSNEQTQKTSMKKVTRSKTNQFKQQTQILEISEFDNDKTQQQIYTQRMSIKQQEMEKMVKSMLNPNNQMKFSKEITNLINKDHSAKYDQLADEDKNDKTHIIISDNLKKNRKKKAAYITLNINRDEYLFDRYSKFKKDFVLNYKNLQKNDILEKKKLGVPTENENDDQKIIQSILSANSISYHNWRQHDIKTRCFTSRSVCAQLDEYPISPRSKPLNYISKSYKLNDIQTEIITSNPSKIKELYVKSKNELNQIQDQLSPLENNKELIKRLQNKLTMNKNLSNQKQIQMINEMRKSNQKVFGMQFGDYSSILKFRTTERIDENIFKDCAKDEIDITTSEKMVSTINEKMNLFKQMQRPPVQIHKIQAQEKYFAAEPFRYTLNSGLIIETDQDKNKNQDSHSPKLKPKKALNHLKK